MQVVQVHDALDRYVELLRHHLYSTEKVGPTVKGHEEQNW
ncbi:hypothetical protein KSS87_017769 [Heliosperma pusillum]|nr:hypothetical protein KSS87_017769 [Heliosperma pusillum]